MIKNVKQVIKNKILEKLIKLDIIGTRSNFEIQINLQILKILNLTELGKNFPIFFLSTQTFFQKKPRFFPNNFS